jgi:hypothetical protein
MAARSSSALARVAPVVVVALCMACVLVAIAVSVQAEVISLPTQCLGRTTIRIHYEAPLPSAAAATAATACRSTLILIGVGTAMQVQDYDALGVAIANSSNSISSSNSNPIVVIVNSVRIFIKLNPVTLNAKPFADALNRVTNRLLQDHSKHNAKMSSTWSSSSVRWNGRFKKKVRSLLPPDVQLCPPNSNNSTTAAPSTANSTLRILVGGHSASGGAAFYALDELYNFDVAGYISLDPFPIRDNAARNVPAVPTLAWGFTTTTCDVTVSQAALAAYEHALVHRRVLYQLQNEKNAQIVSTCRLSHCLFTDRGCPFCRNSCDTTANTDAIHDVALSIQLFVQALVRHDESNTPFTKQLFDSNNFRLNRNLYRIYPFDNSTMFRKGMTNENDIDMTGSNSASTVRAISTHG